MGVGTRGIVGRGINWQKGGWQRWEMLEWVGESEQQTGSYGDGSR